MSPAVRLLPIDDELAAAVRGTRPSTVAFAVGFPRPEDLEPIEARARGAASFLVVDDGVAVGTCGTHASPGRDGALELGWGLVTGARGRGVGTAAVAALLDAVRARYPSAPLFARTEWAWRDGRLRPNSPASEAILARQGFEAGPVPSVPGLRTWRLAGQAAPR